MSEEEPEPAVPDAPYARPDQWLPPGAVPNERSTAADRLPPAVPSGSTTPSASAGATAPGPRRTAGRVVPRRALGPALILVIVLAVIAAGANAARHRDSRPS